MRKKSFGLVMASSLFAATYAFTVGTPTTIAASLSTLGGQFGSAGDFSREGFGNTARIALTLPAGYTFTSTSGNFLTQPGAPGLPLPDVDGGVGVHGAPDAGLTSDGGASGGDGGSSSDASIGGSSGSGDAGASSGDGDNTNGGDDSGGCNAASSGTGGGAAFAMGVLALLAMRRRRAKTN